MKKILPITPEQFRAIILSHGWFSLKPFIANINPPRLIIPFALPHGNGVFEVAARNGRCGLKVISGTLHSCTDVAKNCLSLDISPEFLYGFAKNKWGWLSRNNMGRFLRSPSLFEDCCKIICSTNTTWQRTESMVEKIVGKYGIKVHQYNAFPEPEKLLNIGEKKLKTETGCGFRAKYILNLAESALSESGVFLGREWQALDRQSFYERLIKIKGIGPASANYISLIYWKPQGFNIDAYVKRRCKEIWGLQEVEILPFLAKKYNEFDFYAPIVFWLDITKHWHNNKTDSSNMDW